MAVLPGESQKPRNGSRRPGLSPVWGSEYPFHDRSKNAPAHRTACQASSAFTRRARLGLLPTAGSRLVSSWYSPLTLLSAELEVHSLGGGVMVAVPREADAIRILYPDSTLQLDAASTPHSTGPPPRTRLAR